MGTILIMVNRTEYLDRFIDKIAFIFLLVIVKKNKSYIISR